MTRVRIRSLVGKPLHVGPALISHRAEEALEIDLAHLSLAMLDAERRKLLKIIRPTAQPCDLPVVLPEPPPVSEALSPQGEAVEVAPEAPPVLVAVKEPPVATTEEPAVEGPKRRKRG